MKPKYIIGGVVVIVVVSVVATAITKHNSQNNPMVNTSITANNNRVAQAGNNSGNSQVASQQPTVADPIAQKGKIGDTFTLASVKYKLIKIIEPFNNTDQPTKVSGTGAEFEITNNGGNDLPIYTVAHYMNALLQPQYSAQTDHDYDNPQSPQHEPLPALPAWGLMNSNYSCTKNTNINLIHAGQTAIVCFGFITRQSGEVADIFYVHDGGTNINWSLK